MVTLWIIAVHANPCGYGPTGEPVSVPTSITYNIVLEDNNRTMIVSIEAGDGVFWTYKLVKN